MQRRQFILSTFKTICVTYIGTQFDLSPTLDQDSLGKRHEKTLMAFIDAVVPGCDLNNLNNLSGFYDHSLPMAKYLRILIFRINRITRKLGFNKRFRHLSRAERTKVIQYGYRHSKLDHELFHGAIYLSQVTVYGGIYNQDSSAKFIGFEGSNMGEPTVSTWHYTDLEGLESPLTVDGNYK